MNALSTCSFRRVPQGCVTQLACSKSRGPPVAVPRSYQHSKTAFSALQFLRQHDQLARWIAGNSQRFAATHLVSEGRLCYIKVSGCVRRATCACGLLLWLPRLCRLARCRGTVPALPCRAAAPGAH